VAWQAGNQGKFAHKPLRIDTSATTARSTPFPTVLCILNSDIDVDNRR